MSRPSDYLYTTTHEWLKVEGDIVTLGITDFAQKELTDIVFVELPEIGREVSKDEAVAVVESVKTASDIYASVDGEVMAINNELSEKPELINEDPFGEGWIFKIKITGSIEKENFLDSSAYEEATKSGEHS